MSDAADSAPRPSKYQLQDKKVAWPQLQTHGELGLMRVLRLFLPLVGWLHKDGIVSISNTS